MNKRLKKKLRRKYNEQYAEEHKDMFRSEKAMKKWISVITNA